MERYNAFEQAVTGNQSIKQLIGTKQAVINKKKQAVIKTSAVLINASRLENQGTEREGIYVSRSRRS